MTIYVIDTRITVIETITIGNYIQMKDFITYLILDCKTWEFAKRNIPYIKKNISSNITIISSKKILRKDLLGCAFIDENSLLPKLSFNEVSSYIKKLGGDPKNTGWYLQQFLKLGLAKNCRDEYYLVWDADTIPLNPIDFFDKNGRPYFNLKREYFYSYFRTIKNLFNLKKGRPESFISEHMIFNSDVVREMLLKIEENNSILGENFWQKILNASELLAPDYVKTDQRFFSEFETFGTYCEHFHPKLYATRKLRTLRRGTDFLGKTPSDEILDWAAKDFDTISFEEWGTPIPEMTALTQDQSIREKKSFADTIRLFFKLEKKKIFEGFPKINHEKFRLFLDTIGSTGFDFFFNKKCIYSKKKEFRIARVFDKVHFLQVWKGRFQRYWRLFTFKF